VTFNLSRRLAAEALGTGLLVATVVGSGIMAAKLAGGNNALALLGNTLPTGAILVVLILALAPISGAHFNPAVSLVMALSGALRWREFAPYVVAQVLGGCLGTLAAHGMFDLPLWQFGATARTGPAQWLAEFVATFGLLLTILAVVRFRIEAEPTRLDSTSPRSRAGLVWQRSEPRRVCSRRASRFGEIRSDDLPRRRPQGGG
jgi:glycerol uptake facilitator-like aquaporin